MAIPFLNHITLNQNEARDFGMHLAESGDISSPVAGQLIFDNGTGQDIMKYYNGTEWISVGADTDNYVNAASLTGTTLTLGRTGALSDLTVDLGDIDTNDIDYVSNVTFATNTLTFAGTGNAFSGTVDLSALADADTKQSVSFPTTNANNDFYITFVENNSGAQEGFIDSGFTWNPQTNTLSVDNIIVSGTSTTVNTETINLADNIITLNSNATGTPSENAGIEVERGDSDNVSLNWNETDDDWEFSAYDHAGTPVLTTYKIPRTFATTVGNGTLTTIPVIHNLGTRQVIVQLYDTSSYETVYADVTRTDANTVTLTFASAPTTGDITVLISTAGV